MNSVFLATYRTKLLKFVILCSDGEQIMDEWTLWVIKFDLLEPE